MLSTVVEDTPTTKIYPTGSDGSDGKFIEVFDSVPPGSGEIKKYKFNDMIGVIGRTEKPDTFLIGAKHGVGKVDFASLEPSTTFRPMVLCQRATKEKLMRFHTRLGSIRTTSLCRV